MNATSTVDNTSHEIVHTVIPLAAAGRAMHRALPRDMLQYQLSSNLHQSNTPDLADAAPRHQGDALSHLSNAPVGKGPCTCLFRT